MAGLPPYRRYFVTLRSSTGEYYMVRHIITAETLLAATDRAKSLLWTHRLTAHDGARWDGWTVATVLGGPPNLKIVAYGDQTGPAFMRSDHRQWE